MLWWTRSSRRAMRRLERALTPGQCQTRCSLPLRSTLRIRTPVVTSNGVVAVGLAKPGKPPWTSPFRTQPSISSTPLSDAASFVLPRSYLASERPQTLRKD